METLKKGSRGSDVKKLQELLLMSECDGIFGPATEAAVVEFQATHGLVPVDAIVGKNTWAALLATPSTKVQAGSIDIVYNPINVHITKATNRKVKYIAIHYTAGAKSTGDSELTTRNVFLKREASADFVVDDDTILQINPDLRNYKCWAVGDTQKYTNGGGQLKGIATNTNTISIEINSTLRKGCTSSAANHDGWSMSDSAVDNAVKLTRYLMKEFGIPIDRVVRHYDITGKLCPGVPGWNDAPLYDSKNGKRLTINNTSETWQAFKNRLI